jgi:hypothetical protein
MVLEECKNAIAAIIADGIHRWASHLKWSLILFQKYRFGYQNFEHFFWILDFHPLMVLYETLNCSATTLMCWYYSSVSFHADWWTRAILSTPAS